MRFPHPFMCLAGTSGMWQVTGADSLADVCTTAYVQSVLPANGFVDGVTVSGASVKVNAVTNYAVADSPSYPGKNGLDFCNVTFSYSHTGQATKARTPRRAASTCYLKNT